MFQFQRNNFFSLCIYGIFLLILIVSLGIFFPNPYFQATCDCEAQYFSGIVTAYANGYQVDYMHPGVPLVFIPSFFLSILPFNEDPEYLLLQSRVVLMILNFSMIYLGLILIVRTSLLCTILFISFLFLFPASNYYLELLCPIGILIGVGIIVCSLG